MKVQFTVKNEGKDKVLIMNQKISEIGFGMVRMKIRGIYLAQIGSNRKLNVRKLLFSLDKPFQYFKDVKVKLNDLDCRVELL